MAGLNSNLTESSLLGIKGVRSSFNLPIILKTKEGPTLVKCPLKADVISLFSVRCLFSNSTIATELVFDVFQEQYLWFSTFSKGCLGYPKFPENSNPLQLNIFAMSQDTELSVFWPQFDIFCRQFFRYITFVHEPNQRVYLWVIFRSYLSFSHRGM